MGTSIPTAVHAYIAPVTYTVSWRVRGPGGEHIEIKTDFTGVDAAAPRWSAAEPWHWLATRH